MGEADLFTKHSSFLTLPFRDGGWQTMETSEKRRWGKKVKSNSSKLCAYTAFRLCARA